MGPGLQWLRFHIFVTKTEPRLKLATFSPSDGFIGKVLVMKIRYLLLLSMSVLVFGCEKPRPVAGNPSPEALAPAPAEKIASATNAPDASPDRSGGRPPNGSGDRVQRMEQMLASLGLTADQTQKVQAVMEAQRPAMEALRNDTSLSREQRREKMQAIRQSTDSQLATILTPEQKAKWDQARAQRRERMGRGGNTPPTAPAGTNSTP